MNSNRRMVLLIVIAVFVVAACAPQVESTPLPASTQPATLPSAAAPAASPTSMPTSLPTVTPTAEPSPADRFAGTWSGTMSFTDSPNRKEDIVVSIPSGCTPGNTCGDLANTKVGCKWEMTLVVLNGDVFQYEFSRTLGGASLCDEGVGSGGGTLTLQPDGTLIREHHTGFFTASGVLTKE